MASRVAEYADEVDDVEHKRSNRDADDNFLRKPELGGSQALVFSINALYDGGKLKASAVLYVESCRSGRCACSRCDNSGVAVDSQGQIGLFEEICGCRGVAVKADNRIGIVIGRSGRSAAAGCRFKDGEKAGVGCANTSG